MGNVIWNGQRRNRYYNADGYAMCAIKIPGKGWRSIFVHRLVALAFLPNPNNLPEVNHKDYNRANPCVNNLEWITRKGNVQYSIQNRVDYHGENNPNFGNTKLSEKYKNDSFFADKLSPYKNQEIKELPCYIFDKKEDIENALAVRHISGIKKWDAKEKAEFAIRLYKKENNIKNVTKIIGSKTNTIGALIYSYFWLEYLIESEENKRNDLENLFENKFSLLNLALGQSNIRNFLNINDKWDTIDYNVRKYEKGSKEYDNMLYLCLWLSDYKIISDSRQITGGKTNPISLSAILADNEATNYLKSRTDANSELPDLLAEAYNRISVDSNLVVRFEESYNKINQLMYIYKEKKNNLSDRTIKEINGYCDNIKNIVSSND